MDNKVKKFKKCAYKECNRNCRGKHCSQHHPELMERKRQTTKNYINKLKQENEQNRQIIENLKKLVGAV